MTESDVSPATPIDILLEHTLYIGNTLGAILYGMNIFAFLASIYCISQRPSDYRKGRTFYVVYGAILFALVTLQIASSSLLCQLMWIDHRNHPGGPLGYYRVSQGAWYNVLSFAAPAMANILGDGLLVYRCFIIWGSQWLTIVLLGPIYLASSVLAFITTLETALPNSSFSRAANLLVPWVSLSVALNIIVTSMICFRLLQMRAAIREALTPDTSKVYTSIAAILIESAAPFSIVGIGVVVTAAQKGPLGLTFSYIWGIFCALSPQMIILRVAMGQGLLKETVREMNTALVFAEPATVTLHEQSQGESVTTHSTEGPISDLGVPENKSDMSIKRQMSGDDVRFVSLA